MSTLVEMGKALNRQSMNKEPPLKTKRYINKKMKEQSYLSKPKTLTATFVSNMAKQNSSISEANLRRPYHSKSFLENSGYLRTSENQYQDADFNTYRNCTDPNKDSLWLKEKDIEEAHGDCKSSSSRNERTRQQLEFLDWQKGYLCRQMEERIRDIQREMSAIEECKIKVKQVETEARNIHKTKSKNEFREHNDPFKTANRIQVTNKTFDGKYNDEMLNTRWKTFREYSQEDEVSKKTNRPIEVSYRTIINKQNGPKVSEDDVNTEIENKEIANKDSFEKRSLADFKFTEINNRRVLELRRNIEDQKLRDIKEVDYTKTHRSNGDLTNNHLKSVQDIHKYTCLQEQMNHKKDIQKREIELQRKKFEDAMRDNKNKRTSLEDIMNRTFGGGENHQFRQINKKVNIDENHR